MIKFNNYPTIITRGLFIFPQQSHHIEVGRKKSLAAVTIAKDEYSGYVVALAQKDPMINYPEKKDVFEYGTLCRIEVIVKNKDSLTASLTGVARIRISTLLLKNNCFFTKLIELKDKRGQKNKELAFVRKIVKNLEELTPTKTIPKEIINILSSTIDAVELINLVANYLPMPLEQKVNLIKEDNVNKKLELLNSAVDFELQVNKIETKISEEVKEGIDKNQREYYLRERIRAIQAELGEMENGISETEKYKENIKKRMLPKVIAQKLHEEITKLEKIPSSSAEYSVVRTYIEEMLKIPWTLETKDVVSLLRIKRSLNKKHFGLQKVKERILEYIAVKEKTKSLKSPILCLVGPPGVGKTSLAYSIAEGLKRKFVKMSLGGVKDESEIRGHRRTYLGSMPGRIIKGMMKAKVINPVFLLDEIDKMASDYRGDPASAMLEVLDPEQNKEFSDHYVEEDYDLSKVMFIATANYMLNIPDALRDRLEIIQLSSYTENEKVKIAAQYLIAKVLENNGLKKEQLKISEPMILYIIRHYTQEAGVRSVERLLNKIARKVVLQILNKKVTKVIITIKLIQKYLGKKLFEYSIKEQQPQIGVVTGLAYTQFGGDILPVEVNYFLGKGKLLLTGMLGDVMKESSHIALGFIKANAKKYGIDPNIFSTIDIHIHVPEGATPKDGPSAGVTMTTAIISALTNTPVHKDIAMTGEVNLRGHVLPIGGLREKSISAARSGIKIITIPEKNRKDLEDIPREVKKKLKIIYAKKINDVLKMALVNKNEFK